MIGALVELFTVMICLRFLVAMYSKKETGKIANISWKDSKHLVGTSGDDSSALIEFTPL